MWNSSGVNSYPPTAMSSLLLFVLLNALVFVEPQGNNPFVNTLKEVIHETNIYLEKNHLNVANITAHNVGNFLGDFQVLGGIAGNFATSELIGTPTAVEKDLPGDVTAYYIDLGIGISTVEIELDYELKFLKIFSQTGKVIIANRGNMAETKAIIFSESSGKCRLELTSVVLKDLGDIDFSFKPNSIGKWLLGKFSKAILYVLRPLATRSINNVVKGFAQDQKVLKTLETIVCKYF